MSLFADISRSTDTGALPGSNMGHTKLCFYALLIGCLPTAAPVEPISGMYALGAAVVSLGLASYNVVKCRFVECCTDRWIVNNITDLTTELEAKLYGQHLVKKVVVSHIQGHIRISHPAKALALSFHGPQGTGKNYVSRIIAEALYKKGLKSENVKLISATKDFPHQEMVSLYKDLLRDMVEKQVSKCPWSLFIFDETDKMPTGLLDTIKPYLDYHESLGGVDYRHAIFIFLSNAGGSAITRYALQQLSDGVKREEFKLVEIETILTKAAINSDTKGGLWHSGLISNHLITAFIPFLPLERKHIRQCIRDTMVAHHHQSDRNVPNEILQKVMEELTFFPDKEQVFSVTGCKRVPEKVDYVMLS